MAVTVRLGQRLVQVDFKNGEPYFLYGTVSRVTKTTFDVTSRKGVQKSLTGTGKWGYGWYKRDWLAAIDHQLEDCFRATGIGFFRNADNLSNWSVTDLVALVNRLWRFRKKCLRKLGRENLSEPNT